MEKWQKKEEKDPLAPKTVFTIHHSEIPKGITQCINHVWKKKNETELECVNCPTCVICSADYLNELILR